jgi:transketolase
LNLADNFNNIRHQSHKRLLKLYYDAHSGHLGGSFSCLDTLLILYHYIISTNDRFVLSKGHAAGALYVALWSCGLISDQTLSSFCRDGTTLPGHPSGTDIPGLLFPTGSLGHGPSLSAGLALALKRKNSSGRVFCLCSEGDWQEGSSWEALNFASHQKLDNLVIFLDQNKWQAFGTTQEVMSITDHSGRFLGFDVDVVSVDGHDPEAILQAVSETIAESDAGRPKVIILNTVKGYNLHFQGTLQSHYLPLTKEEYEFACRQIDEKITI